MRAHRQAGAAPAALVLYIVGGRAGGERGGAARRDQQSVDNAITVLREPATGRRWW